MVLADGFGLTPNWQGNAISTANPKNFLQLWKEYRHLVIKSAARDDASPYSTYAELSTGQLQSASLSINSISREILASNHRLLTVFDTLKRNNASIHLVGNITLSGQDDELAALIEILKFAKVNSILDACIHLIIDNSILDTAMLDKFLVRLELELNRIDFGQIATISGKNKLTENNFKNIFKVLFLSQGKVYLSAKQILSSQKNCLPVNIPPSIVQSRQNHRVSSFDLIFFFTPICDELSALLREMIICNRDGTNPGNASFLEFFATAEFPFDLSERVNFLFYKNPALYLSNIFHDKNKTQAVITDQLNLVNINYYFLGNIKLVDQKIASINSNVKSDQNFSSTDEIAELALAEMDKNTYDFIVINFPTLLRLNGQKSFGKCVTEIKLLDEKLGQITKKVLSHDGYLLFCPTIGGAECLSAASGQANYECKNPKNASLPFIMVSASTKHSTKSNLFDEILQSQANLTSINEALKIILLTGEEHG